VARAFRQDRADIVRGMPEAFKKDA
jgi:hypothetical protein